MRIMVALDDSVHSQRALEFVTRVRWPAGSAIVVLSVAQPSKAALSARSGGLTRVQKTVAQAEQTLRENGFATVGMIYEGEPSTALVEAVERERVDLLVVGSHGRAVLAKLMLGSVSAYAVSHAPCSVLVVKGRRESSPSLNRGGAQ